MAKNNAKIMHKVDKEFVSLFNGGFPDCSGVALGMDRFFMLLLNKKKIQEILPFNNIF